MRVAICLATYNGERHLDELVCSISSQTHRQWILFARDDGSKDGTRAMLAERAATDPRIRVVRDSGANSGSPAANFFAILHQIDLAEFDYVCFADQDDVWFPGKIERAIQCLATTGASGYSCDLIAFDNAARKAWYYQKSQDLRRLDYLFQGASAGCTYLLTREAAQLVRDRLGTLCAAFPSNRSHDWLIYAICRSHGLGWHLDKAAHVAYRQHGGNAFGALPGARGLSTRLRLARSGWYREHVLWLGQFLKNSPDEEAVLAAVKRLTIGDRLMLARRVSGFRRRRRDRVMLAATFLAGLF